MNTLLQDYLAHAAERDGDATALVLADRRCSYAELERASNRLAHQLAAVGCRRGDRVCLLMEKSPEAIVAMLACLKAGCAYVPLDIASPPARLALVVSRAEPVAVLVDGRGAARGEELCATGAIATAVSIGGLHPSAAGHLTRPLAFTIADLAAHSAEPPPRIGRGDDLAHLLFTSGSTGVPKGVMITHDNVRAFVEWAVPYFDVRPGEPVSGHPPLHFDLSTFDVYGALRARARLCLVPHDLVLARQLAEFIADHDLVQWFSVPSAMTYMARFGGLPEGGFPTLRRVLWCGEVLPPSVLGDWMRRVPQASYTNLYGPTETTIASSYHTVTEVPDDGGEPIPIGRPCGGEDVFVTGEDGGPAAVDEVGEIQIAGAGVSPGYWREPELTAAAFVPDPRPAASGSVTYRTGDLGRVDAQRNVHFHGRRDGQIKSRGYRIELMEIETAVSALAGVAECAVVAIPAADFSGTTICCAFVADARPAQRTHVGTELRRALPAYMVPTRWDRLEVLPRNANGKVDRAALRDLFAGRRPAEIGV